jgi:hypothetical protein
LFHLPEQDADVTQAYLAAACAQIAVVEVASEGWRGRRLLDNMNA